MCYSHLQPLDPSENPDLWCDPQYNPDLGEMAPPAPNADGVIGKDYFIKNSMAITRQSSVISPAPPPIKPQTSMVSVTEDSPNRLRALVTR
jgi:hypothetical protein